MILIYFLSLFFNDGWEEWTREIGVGDGGVVHRDGVLYVASSDLPNQISLLAIDASNGQLNWRQDFVQEANTRQEVSAEYPVRPLAPPVLGTASGVTAVAFMDFGGKLRVVSTERGKLLWESDLVKQFDATPVQYGFASSGITMGSQLIVPVGGPQTSVVAFRLNDGAIEWKSGPAEIGYASPIELKRNSQIEVVVALKDLLRSIEPATGKTLWEWKYPNQGLTNAPTPLVIGKSQLLVAGQGCDGTRLLDVSSGSNGVNPTE